MAQPIKPAQIQMDLVSQGTGMRNTTAPPGAQMLLDPTANPMMSNQPFRQAQHAQQNLMARGQEKEMQGLAGAQRQQDQAIRSAAEAEEMARGLKRETVGLILEKADTPALDMLFADKGLAEKVTRDAMQQQAITEQLSPDLADYSGQLMA